MPNYASKKTNIFLSQSITYFIPESIDEVRQRLNDVVSDRRWFRPVNISGKFNDDGSFSFAPQWSFTVIRWIETSPAYLSGRLREAGDETAVAIILRPNSFSVCFLYGLGLLFVMALLGKDDFIEGPRLFKFLFYPFFAAILYGIMHWQTVSLRSNFERILGL